MRAGVLLYCGDNLEANDIGGFQRNFSAGFPCRVCRTPYKEIKKTDGNITAEFWTKETYDAIVDKIEALPDGDKPDFPTYGLRTAPPLNKLEAFHAVDSIAFDFLHDYCEGVGAFDAAYILKVYILVHKTFTVDAYNAALRSIVFRGQDARDKPQPIKNASLMKKLPGKAMSVVVTIRYLPSILQSIVGGHRDLLSDNIFQLLLLLHELLEICLAEEIEKDELQHVRDLIGDYFALRCNQTVIDNSSL